MTRHPYHIVDIRPWPLTRAVGTFFMTAGLGRYLNKYDQTLRLVGLIILIITLSQWWRDVTREAVLQGKHSNKVEDGLRLGILLFITREVCFFFTFFWTFFHSSLSVGHELGGIWPPVGVEPLNPFDVPLLNTTVLLSSGATITWAHMSLLNSQWLEAHISFAATVMLGSFFTFLQAVEYSRCSFTIADSVLGSTFYVVTGFHGLHVVIGSLFIAVIWIRHYINHFSSLHHIGFEASAWYWHFVDVVWLLLFICLYWWGF